MIVVIVLAAGLVAAEAPRVAPAPQGTRAPEPPPASPTASRPQRLASYDITARLDGKKHEITGSLKLTWHNASEKPATKLLFHLYLNAFKNETTHWMGEALRHRLDRYVGKGDWGSITVKDLKVAGVAAKQIQHISDGTVLKVVPAQPVAGASTVEIVLSFHAVLPRVRARTGFWGDFHMVAQWFPKIGVREPDGTWRCHPFYMTSEFYADFGVYRVIAPRLRSASITITANGRL